MHSGITTDDATGTVTYHLTKPDPNFLYELALPCAWPIPSSAPLQPRFGGSVPGTGPYRVVHYAPIGHGHPGKLSDFLN